MAYNIADLFEHTVDAVPDRIALITDTGVRRTFAELDDRANRFAHYLLSQGVAPGDHVAIYAMNSEAWLLAMLGGLKVRAVPVNVNFRYVEAELKYLLDNSDSVACVFDAEYASRLAAVIDDLPTLNTCIHIGEGTDGESTTALKKMESTSVENAMASMSAERDFGERSGDDQFIIYTGGTTGMPKGVVWRSEDIYFALGQGIDALTGERVATEFTKAEQAAAGGGLVFCVIPPLMHGAAQIATLSQWFIGSTIVLLTKFDAESVWNAVSEHGINSTIVTGDAIARPLIEMLEAHPGRWDTSSLLSVSSSAALFSQSVKDRFLEAFPDLVITDSIGSTESGFNGVTYAEKGAITRGGGPTVDAGADVVILDDDLALIPRGDTRQGKIGRGGNIPLGYYNDEKKTAETFVTAGNGERFAVAGDLAQWTDEGRMVMLGRGTVSINTGGEKVFPEEVEQALKAHPAVFDCLVVGVPDERWGQRVAAVVQFRDDTDAPLEELAGHARTQIAGYKMPRELHVVEEITRSPSGKPDYRWAKNLAESAEFKVSP